MNPRTATYTHDPDEIELSYRDATNKPCQLYYSRRQYDKRQSTHGRELYPDPIITTK